jgi:hypothetical protein
MKAGPREALLGFRRVELQGSQIQILELTQASIQGPIEDLVVTPEWGNPTEYDITISKKGQKLDTEYSVQPSPHKPVAEDVATLFKATHVDLPALFDGKDPLPSEPKDNIASSSRTTSRISASLWRRTDRQRKGSSDT